MKRVDKCSQYKEHVGNDKLNLFNAFHRQNRILQPNNSEYVQSPVDHKITFLSTVRTTSLLEQNIRPCRQSAKILIYDLLS